LSIANGYGQPHDIQADLSRPTLSSNLNCNCDRVVFNASVSNSFGSIYKSTLTIGIVASIVIFGAIMGLTYKKRKKSKLDQKLTKGELLKWSVMLLAIAAGLVHLAVYSDHALLRIEYSIFLLTAGASQIAYGMLYALVTLTNTLLLQH
jgi:hypothetical protein